MRSILPLFFILFLFSTISCGTPATLYTDEIFRSAAPEVVRAWKSGLFRDAQVVDLPQGGGRLALQTALNRPGASPIALIGLSLPASDRQALVAAHPKTRFLFFLSGEGAPQETTIGVRRAEAWALVGNKAAAPGLAIVLFPSDVKTEEIQEFETAWRGAGGGPLSTSAGYRADIQAQHPVQVFHWAGPDMDPQVQALGSQITVHGNPGTIRSPGASGLTWATREKDLGDFLWKAALETARKSYFLPLETLLDRR